MQMSGSIGELASALAKAQGQLRAAPKDRDNPFYKSTYATLAAVIEAIREPLTANNLSFSQPTRVGDDGRVYVTTILMHGGSGEFISGECSAQPTKPDPQGIGSLISYMKRYGLQAMVGIASADDDGNEASGKSPQKIEAAAAPKAPPADKMVSAGGVVLNFTRAGLEQLMDEAVLGAADRELVVYDSSRPVHKRLFGMACMLLDVLDPERMRRISEKVLQLQVPVLDLKPAIAKLIEYGDQPC